MLSPRWRKVAQDIWSNKTRTILVVLSIAVGVFAIGMIGGTQIVLSRDLSTAYMAVNPPSATLYTDPFDDALVDTVRGLPAVAEAEGRRNFTVRVRSGPERWTSLSLTALRDYRHISINKMTPESGSWPPGQRELLLERTSLQFLGFRVGDTATVELPDGTQRTLQVAGSVHNINLPPPMFTGTAYGYVSVSTLEWLGQPDNLNELHILVADNQMDRQHIQAVADEVRGRVERTGRTVYYTYIPDPGKHPIDSALQVLLLLLGALGLLSLVLSGFLVVNTISALLSQQTRQIGIMKAIGARAGQIAGMYLTTVLAFGVLALMVGIPLGLLAAYGLSGYLAAMLNFDLVGLTIAPEVLIPQIVVGLTVPLVAALYPIISGTRVTAREAMSSYGVANGRFGRGRIDRLLERVRGLSRPLLLSLRNTFRRKGRLALTLITLTLGGAIFIAVFSVRDSVMVTLDEALGYFNYDVEVAFRRLHRVELMERAALSVPGVLGAQSLGAAGVRRVRDDGSESRNLYLLALPAETDLIEPTLLEGRWLLPEDENAIVVNTMVLKYEPDIRVNDEVLLKIDGRERPWRVVGIVRGVMTGPIAYANQPYFTQVARTVGRAGAVWLVTEPQDAATRLQTIQALEERYRTAGMSVRSTEAIADVRAMIADQFDIIIVFLLIMAALLAVVGCMGLTGTMSLNVIERTREIGVMRAVGASDGSVMQVFIAEGVIIGVLSWLLGMVLALPIGQLLSNVVGESFIQAPLTYVFSYGGAALWLGLVVLLAAVASLLPARNASRLTVREVLAYE